MLKAKVTGDAGDTVIIGLSAGNIARLQQKKPIYFDLSEIGMAPLGVLVVAGETEDSIAEELEEFVTLANPNILVEELPTPKAH